jgi:hypothetical protein
MPRVTQVRAAQQRYATVPDIDPATGEQRVIPILRKDGTPKLTKTGRPIVRRVTVEDRTQPKPNRNCGKCGVEIKVGDPYKWVAVKRQYGGVKYYRCATCPNWQQSELSSSKMAGVYAAQEQCDADVAGCESADDLQSLAQDLAEQIRGVAEEYEESGNNMEEGFGHATYLSDELKEKAESLNSWADEVENTDFDDFDVPEEDQCETCEGEGQVEDAENDDANEDGKVECEDCGGTGQADNDGTAYEEHWEEQRQKLIDAMGECPV